MKENELLPECRNLQLLDFLITPLQRITRYPLLLQTLLSKTPIQHPEYEEIKGLLEKMKEVVALVNRTTGKAENVLKMKKIEQSFGKDGQVSNC
jgi:SH3 domain-containing guanine exchange factor